MAIERLSSEQGEIMPRNGSRTEMVRRIKAGMLLGRVTAASLMPGEYDITPKIWTRHLRNHHLQVNPDGTAVYRAIPREQDVGDVLYEDGRYGEFNEGVRTIHLPQDETIIIVAGPKADVPEMHIFEVIFYHG